MRGATLVLVALVMLVLGICANLLFAQVPNEDRALRAVENLGLTDVGVIQRSPAWGVFGGCHQNDVTRFTVMGFTAEGKARTIEVCAPLVGGYTIRS
jgi:hypothetical protein